LYSSLRNANASPCNANASLRNANASPRNANVSMCDEKYLIARNNVHAICDFISLFYSVRSIIPPLIEKRNETLYKNHDIYKRSFTNFYFENSG
jgi:hypothetical protein